MPSPILERVKAHREALGRKEIEVAEWSDDDGAPTIFFSTPITLGEMRRWYKGISGEDISVLVDVVITKADDGTRRSRRFGKKLRSDPFRLSVFGLAERLHRTVLEIEELTVDEFLEWVAYFKITEDQNGSTPQY